MSNLDDGIDIPAEVTEAAQMAQELHARLFPQGTPDPEPSDQPQSDPEPPAEPELQPNNDDQAPAEPSEHVEDEGYRRKYEILQGKYAAEVPRMAKELRDLREQLSKISTPPQPEAPQQPQSSARDEILAKLNEEYPEELVSNLLTLMRMEAEERVQEHLKPVQETVARSEEDRIEKLRGDFIATANSQSNNWQDVWQVAYELREGLPASDPEIENFLRSPDPSGLFTNYDLIHAYNSNFDAAKFAKVCNLYQPEPEPVPAPAPKPNPAREALVAPSRAKTQPASPSNTEQKIWTMAEFNQFQVDARNDVYDPETKDAMWKEFQTALAQGRLRG